MSPHYGAGVKKWGFEGLQRPLEICLKHSAVSVPDGSACPLVQPRPGVAALHEYAEWITELSDRRGDAERE